MHKQKAFDNLSEDLKHGKVITLLSEYVKPFLNESNLNFIAEEIIKIDVNILTATGKDKLLVLIIKVINYAYMNNCDFTLKNELNDFINNINQ